MQMRRIIEVLKLRGQGKKNVTTSSSQYISSRTLCSGCKMLHPRQVWCQRATKRRSTQIYSTLRVPCHGADLTGVSCLVSSFYSHCLKLSSSISANATQDNSIIPRSQRERGSRLLHQNHETYVLQKHLPGKHCKYAGLHKFCDRGEQLVTMVFKGDWCELCTPWSRSHHPTNTHTLLVLKGPLT